MFLTLLVGLYVTLLFVVVVVVVVLQITARKYITM